MTFLATPVKSSSSIKNRIGTPRTPSMNDRLEETQSLNEHDPSKYQWVVPTDPVIPDYPFELREREYSPEKQTQAPLDEVGQIKTLHTDINDKIDALQYKYSQKAQKQKRQLMALFKDRLREMADPANRPPEESTTDTDFWLKKYQELRRTLAATQMEIERVYGLSDTMSKELGRRIMSINEIREEMVQMQETVQNLERQNIVLEAKLEEALKERMTNRLLESSQYEQMDQSSTFVERKTRTRSKPKTQTTKRSSTAGSPAPTAVSENLIDAVSRQFKLSQTPKARTRGMEQTSRRSSTNTSLSQSMKEATTEELHDTLDDLRGELAELHQTYQMLQKTEARDIEEREWLRLLFQQCVADLRREIEQDKYEEQTSEMAASWSGRSLPVSLHVPLSSTASNPLSTYTAPVPSDALEAAVNPTAFKSVRSRQTNTSTAASVLSATTTLPTSIASPQSSEEEFVVRLYSAVFMPTEKKAHTITRLPETALPNQTLMDDLMRAKRERRGGRDQTG
ncbi:hypothetical protein BLNAU_11949 [Blattamonas nauphoetae]|uniref:Uncharacterized protein n=1 Tax=Blattamonas nauphoetae TaxID=2049346 RepID=A0ABQ9XP92_9EUKA|nr:hypothetical protein BLNAU_11949 [Blattamonas nauphoetae]